MKLSHTLLICACLVFASTNFSNAVTPAPATQQQVQKWEYLTVLSFEGDSAWEYEARYGNGDDAPYDGRGWRDEAGNDGWELIFCYQDGLKPWFSYQFKRPKN
jgi:hypothetical protein